MTTLKTIKKLTVLLLIPIFFSFRTSEPDNKGRFYHQRYFENTPYELNVYKIIGRQPGKRLLIIGGIHNEPGGYLTADHFVDVKLEKGTLIVVPRANFHTIISDKRGINGDMNRKFTPDKLSGDYDSQIVEILKNLMAEADILLNLHSGSGFYRYKYISKNKNPWKFGQSIIADTDIFNKDDSDNSINLKEIAEEVIRNVNKKIDNKEYFFHFNNHNTFSNETKHPEQRRSATFFALSHFGIPAFGIESSRDILELETKVRHQIWIINEFMRFLDIVPEIPGLYLEYPELRFVIVSVNDGNPIMIPNKKTLHIKENDNIEVSYIEANYERGLTANILNNGTLNDFSTKINIRKSTKIVIKKDQFYCGEIYVDVIKEKKDKESLTVAQYNYLVLDINGLVEVFDNSHSIETINGDIMRIIDTVPSTKSKEKIRINFYGFQKQKDYEKDDRNHIINTATDLIPKFSLNGSGMIYEIRVESGRDILSKFNFKFIKPKLHYIVLRDDKDTYKIPEGETVSFNKNEQIEILEASTNIKNDKDIKVNFRGFVGAGDGEDRNMKIPLDNNLLTNYSINNSGKLFEITVSRKGNTFGRIFIKIKENLSQKLD